MNRKIFFTTVWSLALLAALIIGPSSRLSAQTYVEPVVGDYASVPTFISAEVPPLVMIAMGRDHKLYYEAYNDASDLDMDGDLDVHYNPNLYDPTRGQKVDYYGYFDSYKCYEYSSSNGRFEPSSITTDKKCSGANEWSGDFLNYLTMSRMDCLRKVLYGGYRSTDTATETVLQRAYIPQDAHTWGKEYKSVARDGYDIQDYTPLALPDSGTYHLFASTTLSDNGDPLLRVLPNNTHRIWEWVSKEQPVADSSLVSSGTTNSTHPADQDDFDDLISQYANSSHLYGSGVPSNGQINGSGNPYGSDDYYLTVFTGQIDVTTAGTYQFAVDGDDALELYVDGQLVASWYGGHGKCNCTTHTGSITLTAGLHDIVFRHEEVTGADNYYLYWKGPDSGDSMVLIPASKYVGLIQSTYNRVASGSTITDYKVRVQVCLASMPESSAQEYPDGNYKPVGLLQKFGATGKLFFGLMSGSYAKNTDGGVLRRNVSDISDEINPNTGQFTSVNGIISTINKFRIVGYSYSSYSHSSNCGWIATRAINPGECRMWGNPIGEIVYEALRYFGGLTPTSDFLYSGTTDDSTLGLPLATWEDPYENYDHCSNPYLLIISDITPSFDTDKVPGTYFNTFSGSLDSFNATTMGNTIGTNDGISGNYFIGQSGSVVDTSCSPKDVTAMGQIRGLCPEEPTKKGGYYAASAAYYGHINDVNTQTTAPGTQNLWTYAVGLASPLPRIEIPINGSTITMVPFAKSVGGYSISASSSSFQPTNTIVDFYVDTITSTYGKFRINFEDVEQGADHDMDAIVIYEYQVNADNTVTITLTSEYAAGSIIQHMGYIISGTTKDGTYLEVRDYDTGASSDPDYYLDTPPGVWPTDTNPDWDDDTALPLTNTRTFSPGSAGGAKLTENPLWYAAKWGAFSDQNENDIPDLQDEWDTDHDGVPDTYFYVSNPLYLEEQLTKSFSDILRRASSGTAVSVLATSSEGEGTLVQAYFKPTMTSGTEELTWIGYLHALWVDDQGRLREDSSPQGSMPKLILSQDKIVDFYFDEQTGSAGFRRFSVDANGEPVYNDNNGNGIKDDDESYVYTLHNLDEMESIWKAGDLLQARDSSTRTIKTFVDVNKNGTVDSGEFLDFSTGNSATIGPFLGVKSEFYNAFLGTGTATADDRRSNLIKFIRGDDSGYVGTTALRNRDLDGQIWKLGDIVNSTPVTVGRPSESYSLIYSDESYLAYYKQYLARPQVVYVGGNDGMLHAFMMGIYHSEDDTTTTEKETGYFTLPSWFTGTYGDEIWGFVPQSVLPHLKWLAMQEYPHTYYVDLKPRVVDARVFDSTDGVHTQGWGTILLCGLNMGGKTIQVQDDFQEGTDTLRTFHSCYFAMDVTDPANPKLLWEISPDDIGLTTGTPTLAKAGDTWYVILGSGPTDYDGTSDQKAHIYVVNLATGAILKDYECLEDQALMGAPVTVDIGLNYSTDAGYYGETYWYQKVDEDGNPLDEDGNLVTAAAGNVQYEEWRGRIYRIIIPKTTGDWRIGRSTDVYDTDTDNWTIQPFYDFTGPISAAVAPAFDKQDNLWLYFGTGRYYGYEDKIDQTTQYFYGIKDPYFNGTLYGTAADVAAKEPDTLDILDTSASSVYTDRTVTGISGVTNWAQLLALVRTKDGWQFSLGQETENAGERVLNKATVLGGIVYDTTFVPNEDPCGYSGNSNLIAFYYLTGTSYYLETFLNGSVTENVGGEDKTKVLNKTSVGAGRASGVSVHVGKESGATGYIQQSTGIVQDVQLNPAESIRSGFIYWRER